MESTACAEECTRESVLERSERNRQEFKAVPYFLLIGLSGMALDLRMHEIGPKWIVPAGILIGITAATLSYWFVVRPALSPRRHIRLYNKG